VIASWVMLPFHSDLLAAGSETLCWLGIGLVLFALARALGATSAAAGAGAALFMSIPTLRLLIGSGYSEPLACLCFAAGCLFAVLHVRERRAGQLVLAYAALGLAIGMKISFVRASAALLVTLAGYSAVRPPRDAIRVRAWVAAALALALVIMPWALRTAAETGLPLSPLPIEVLGVTLGRAAPEVAWLLHRPELHADFAAEWHVLATVFGGITRGREVLSWLALVPVAAALGWLIAHPRRAGLGVWMLALAALGDTATFFSADLAVVRLRWPETSSRLLLCALLICIAIAALWSRTGPRAERGCVLALRACAVLLLLVYAKVGWSPSSALAAALLLCAALAYAGSWRWTAALRLRAKWRRSVLAFAAFLLLAGLAQARSALRYTFMRSDYVVHATATFWVDAARALDDPAQSRRIAVTGGPSQDMDRWFVYPFFGQRLQNRIVYVSPLADGSIAHYAGPDALAELAPRIDPRAWLRRLRSAGVTHVVTFDPMSLERRIMDDNPKLFRPIAAPELRAFGAFELAPRAAR
jgi:hypothetical protein